VTDIRLFDYDLPEELIAQYPARERDASRLLVVDRASGETAHRHFFDLPEYLRAGDLLVFNDSRVIRARLIGRKEDTGARIELFLLKRVDADMAGSGRTQFAPTDTGECWEVLARPAKRLHVGRRILFDKKTLSARVLSKKDDGSLVVGFEYEGIFLELLERIGHIPLPPYIRRAGEEADALRYQTVYARESGSAAAPTAGLHFTESLLARLREKGVETAFVTLHVGLGTFRPVQTDVIEEHRMHEEYYYINAEARERINRAKDEERRIICVGTTSVRTIESASVWNHEGGRSIPEANMAGSTDIFIYPGGRQFFMTDGMITNFHLPKSTLLMLVSAFTGRARMLDIYREAVETGYRFFSYGDAMLIL
jgi:S-adenosylmethionine:tRNA ribosyltransferase-isomerase